MQDAARAEPAPSSPAGANASAFYRYRDASGRVVIVDSLARVPASARASTEALVLAPAGATHASDTNASDTNASTTSAGDTALALARELHAPSFIAGASCAAFCALLLFVLERKLGRMLRGALVVGGLGLGVVAYFGWVRRSSGHGEELLASPRALVDDARAAVQKMNERSAEQQRTLNELGGER